MEGKTVHMVLNTYHADSKKRGVDSKKRRVVVMVNFSAPADVVLSDTKEQILRALQTAKTPLSIRQLARVTNISHVRAQEIVNHFADRGLILIDQVGRSHLCTLNRTHITASPIIELLNLDTIIVQVIKTEITKWRIKPVSATLFGSAARGGGSSKSDIDIFTIRPEKADTESKDWASQLFESGEKIRLATGNDVSWFDLNLRELAQAKRSREPLLQRVRKDGVHLAGKGFEELLGRAKSHTQR